jgi:hypothetical protein
LFTALDFTWLASFLQPPPPAAKTFQDDGHQFGLPAPVDAWAEVNQRLARAVVEAVVLRQRTLDLELRFNTGHAPQILPDSSGYEAWTLSSASSEFMVVGGGELANFGDQPNTSV